MVAIKLPLPDNSATYFFPEKKLKTECLVFMRHSVLLPHHKTGPILHTAPDSTSPTFWTPSPPFQIYHPNELINAGSWQGKNFNIFLRPAASPPENVIVSSIAWKAQVRRIGGEMGEGDNPPSSHHLSDYHPALYLFPPLPPPLLPNSLSRQILKVKHLYICRLFLWCFFFFCWTISMLI